MGKGLAALFRAGILPPPLPLYYYYTTILLYYTPKSDQNIEVDRFPRFARSAPTNKNNVFIEFIEFIVKSKPFFSKNSIKIFFDKFDKFFDKWTL
jgi:hypothetical protein